MPQNQIKRSRGAPPGNRNAASARPWKTAIEFVIKRHKKGGREILQELAAQLVDEALAGDRDSRRELFDRIDGRPIAAVDMNLSVSTSIADQLRAARERQAVGYPEQRRSEKTIEGECGRNPAPLPEPEPAPAPSADWDTPEPVRAPPRASHARWPIPSMQDQPMSFIEAMARKRDD